ncbi:ABC transporter ATP-binding protein [Rossellomorea vietnamensis]|uniref:ABC transporter ATP-binding protein n=1 Tax=Rossellomorea vietnamensis TaxID=218284 RepID=UPI00077C1BE8|nr:ABC transporter ATP-binding protein [Rossellomorea vietnamensis]MCA0147485.1 ABC transporter ATP-binding protein [Rossellomorea vietnamensis]OXS63061.1 bacitracin ABC transporter ATP-binding protein [Bacillus sp. DSM 27956]PRX77909.1 ABC-2 type transport system ATP-binding protein [Bacillus sp. V-88]SLK19265.1 ABC-2 type transport system ATP-binding protein [Bacillus sp. V-88]
MKTVVQLQGVSKVIKGKTIIDQLTFDVYEGEVFGFLGPNGAGKTTTIRMIVGLMNISKGDVLISGKSIKKDFEGAIKDVGAIVENPELYKFMSGYQNLKHFARMQKGITDERMKEVIELVGLTDRINDKVKTYSLGMRQRLGLAQCLLHKPKLLILDEPTNGLDPAGIREIRAYIRKLAEEEGMAVIVSSHLLSEMEMMCDRIGIIQSGKLVDVQQVRDFVEGSEQVYHFEIEEVDKVKAVLKSFDPGIKFEAQGKQVQVALTKEQVPDVIRAFVEADVQIYSVMPVAKTLEDRFLEITNDKGEVMHA